MGEIRIFGPGKTRGYPYPVCKKRGSSTLTYLIRFSDISFLFNIFMPLRGLEHNVLPCSCVFIHCAYRKQICLMHPSEGYRIFIRLYDWVFSSLE